MIMKRLTLGGVLAAALAGAPSPAFAGEPALTNLTVNGRVVERSLDVWGKTDGYEHEIRSVRLVQHPKVQWDRPGRPLYVVLHSAGHTAQQALDCTRTPGNHDIYRAPDDFFALYLDCTGNDHVDWWWGYGKHPGFAPSPCEQRVMKVIEETVRKYGIDRDRIYLSGNSMGASGALGIGIRHGDVFAAVKANTPAHIDHACDRMGWGVAAPADARLPDPPVVIDYSAQNDTWSHGHERLIEMMRVRKYPYFLTWAPFGHANNDPVMLAKNDLIHSFDWLSVRKSDICPVFTHATSDTALPWPDRLDDPAPGQVNAFFRWSDASDAPDGLSVRLFLKRLDSKFFVTPVAATATVSFRRLRRLVTKPGDRFAWTFGDRRGTVTVGADGVLTVAGLEMTETPTVLAFRRAATDERIEVDAAEYGFSPEATPAANAAALQKALCGGGKRVTVTKAGTYGLDRTVYLDDDTVLTFAKGTVLKKTKAYSNVLVNRGAWQRGVTNRNLTVENFEIAVNGMQQVPPLDSPAQGLRGQLAFSRANNVTVRGFRCLDCAGSQYCTQFVGFDGLLIEDFEIRGKKDGIHLNAGRNFVIRRGVLETGDDGIALNAGEWPGGCTPLMGSVTDGLIEDVTDDPGGSCNFVRVIAGSWLDWHPGMKLQNRDIVRVGRNVYGIHPMPVSTNEFVSLTAPSNTCGVWKSPEGINFLWLQADGQTRADVERVTIRNVRMNCKRSVCCAWEVGAWARLVHPELPRGDYPKIDIRLENVVKTAPGPIVNGYADAKIGLRNCRAEKGELVTMKWMRPYTPCPVQEISVDGGAPQRFATGDVHVR